MLELLFATPAVLLGALIKWCITSNGNLAALVLTSFTALMTGLLLIQLHYSNKLQKYAKQFWPGITLVGVIALEFLLYAEDIFWQILATLFILTCLLLLYKPKNEQFYSILFAWITLRFIFIIITQNLSYIALWHTAQIVLLLIFIIPKQFIAVGSASVFVAVLVLYSYKNVVPHSIPFLLVALPLMYVALLPLQTKKVIIDVKVLLVIVIITCMLFPHHSVDVKPIDQCTTVPNTQICAQYSLQTQITDSCCCKPGFIKMPQQNACVRDLCLSNFKRDPSKDCCKISRNPETENFLSGEYMCLCNNQPGQITNTFDANTQSCVCNNGLTGDLCNVKTT